MNPGWQLINAEERARAHPQSFAIAPRAERVGLAAGRLVKIGVENKKFLGMEGANGERFFVEIVSYEKGRYHGTIQNDLVFSDAHGLDYMYRVYFGPEHILQTEPPPPAVNEKELIL